VTTRHQLAVLARYHGLNYHFVSGMLVHCELESTSWLTITNVMSVLLMFIENQDIISVCVLVFGFCQAYIHNIVEFQISTDKLLTG
jgi:hypothetical protein